MTETFVSDFLSCRIIYHFWNVWHCFPVSLSLFKILFGGHFLLLLWTQNEGEMEMGGCPAGQWTMWLHGRRQQYIPPFWFLAVQHANNLTSSLCNANTVFMTLIGYLWYFTKAVSVHRGHRSVLSINKCTYKKVSPNCQLFTSQEKQTCFQLCDNQTVFV